ncbi:hypothetical protein LOD99_2286 [Oopsacas minuta]|uniref:Protein zwilch n=1 Tax=Oopsacas minuta TaxID=111878 RepID=A0AAV7K197_9METZ|nr:hypothetical protein LOD99_2286 [Oopsacas minuta]
MWTLQDLYETIQQSKSNNSPLQHGELLLQTNESLTYLGNEEEIPLIMGPDIEGVTLFSSKNDLGKMSSPLEGFNIPDSRLGGSFSQEATISSTQSPNIPNLLPKSQSHLIRKKVLFIGDHLPAKLTSCSYQNYNVIPTQSLFPISFSTAQSLLNNYVIVTKSISLSPLLVHCSPPNVGESFSMVGSHCTPHPDMKLDIYRTFGLVYKGIRSKTNLLKELDIANFISKECLIPIETNCKFKVTSKYDTVYFSNNYRVYITAQWNNPKSLLSAPPLDFLPSINFEITLNNKHSLQTLQSRELSFLKNLIFSDKSVSNNSEEICNFSVSDGISKCLEDINSASPDATFIQQNSNDTRPLLDCTEIIWTFVREYCTHEFSALANLLTSLIEGVVSCEITPYIQPENNSYLATLIRECSQSKDVTLLTQNISDTGKLTDIVIEIGILKLFGDYLVKLSSKSILSIDSMTQKLYQFDGTKKLKFLTLLHTLCEIGIISESHLKLSRNETRTFLSTLYDHFVNKFDDFDISATSRLTYHLKQRSSSIQTLKDICSRVPCSLWHLEANQEKEKFSVSFVNRELFQTTSPISEDLLNPYYFYMQRITSCVNRRSAT